MFNGCYVFCFSSHHDVWRHQCGRGEALAVPPLQSRIRKEGLEPAACVSFECLLLPSHCFSNIYLSVYFLKRSLFFIAFEMNPPPLALFSSSLWLDRHRFIFDSEGLFAWRHLCHTPFLFVSCALSLQFSWILFLG